MHPAVTCPTVFRQNPYIHFDRGADGRISGLRQAREGDPMPEEGESDTGFFCFETQTARDLLAALRREPEQQGSSTGEFNFLPVIPLAAHRGLDILTPALMTPGETVGINSAADAVATEVFLNNPNARTDQHID